MNARMIVMNIQHHSKENPLTKAVVKAKTANNHHLKRVNRLENYSFSLKTTIYGRVKGANHHLQTLHHNTIIKAK
jgi:hypothetical protein